MLFGKKKSVAGLDIGSSSIKLVELEGKLNNLNLVGIGYENLPDTAIVEGQIMELNTVAEAIQSAFQTNQIKADQVITGVSGYSVIVKTIVLPPMSQEELEESIVWHAEEQLGFRSSEVNFDYHITEQTPEYTKVLIAACRKERIEILKQAIQFAGKQPSAIDVDTFALQNCYEVNYQPYETDVVALLNIGASTTNVNIVRGVTSLFMRDITMGGNQFTDALQKGLGISFQQAEAIKRGVRNQSQGFDEQTILNLLEPTMEYLAMEIQRTFDFFRASEEGYNTNVQKILISGGGSKLARLPEYLSSKLELPVEVLDPFRQIKVNTKKFDPDYLSEIMPEMALAVGLAIRGV
ncbi:MAG: type IV pilus assembly protein PilM [Pyrinomonadaceae bacterium]|nr:type IV pilus assembly protein PilM [Pyrinomonadaceae bacterium]MCX7639969.1 type IV pilus assembly protein PilM [Pyrinomonadaceae bacterium]MDW8304141.1 type IV pilus assembly protein PilM [Acidobacteriota bacterium]